MCVCVHSLGFVEARWVCVCYTHKELLYLMIVHACVCYTHWGLLKSPIVYVPVCVLHLLSVCVPGALVCAVYGACLWCAAP